MINQEPSENALDVRARESMSQARAVLAGSEAGWRMACILLMGALRRGESLEQAMEHVRAAPQAAAHVARDVQLTKDEAHFKRHLSTKDWLKCVRVGYRESMEKVIVLYDIIEKEAQDEQGTGNSEKD